VKDGAKLPKSGIEVFEIYFRFFLQVEIGMISTGPERDATIVPAGERWLGAFGCEEILKRKKKDTENVRERKGRRGRQEKKRLKLRAPPLRNLTHAQLRARPGMQKSSKKLERGKVRAANHGWASVWEALGLVAGARG